MNDILRTGILFLAMAVLGTLFLPSLSWAAPDGTTGGASTVDGPTDGDSSEDSEEKSKLDVKSFFCNTRYSQKIDDKESQRKSSCQKGYDGESCGAPPEKDKDGVYAACMAGAKADKPLAEEMGDEDLKKQNEALKNADPPELNTKAPNGGLRCGSVDTAYIGCPQNNSRGVDGTAVWGLLNAIINIAIAIVGITAIGGLVFAGTIYASAGDDQSRVAHAKSLIFNIIVGLVVFAAAYVLLQFIIPGGIF